MVWLNLGVMVSTKYKKVREKERNANACYTHASNEGGAAIKKATSSPLTPLMLDRLSW